MKPLNTIRLGVILAVVAAFALTGCLGAFQGATIGTSAPIKYWARMDVTVTDTVSGQPVAGADVTFVDFDDKPMREVNDGQTHVTTDTHGHASIDITWNVKKSERDDVGDYSHARAVVTVDGHVFEQNAVIRPARTTTMQVWVTR